MTDEQGRHDATEHTVAQQRRFLTSLPPDDPRDHERVRRGFIARHDGPIENQSASSFLPVSWDTDRFEFVQGDAPDTVNPALWRQAKLNGEHGLFQVIDGFYQVRGYDTSVVTFIRGETGWVVIDPLTTSETAATAYGLVEEHLEDLPVTAVIYTHTHLDHYAGVLGVVSRDRIEAGECPIVAPEGFMAAAVAENVAAQAAMGRRASYQYGMLLPWDERGHVDQGLAKGVPVGSMAMIPPTIEITETGQELVLDGIRIEFQLTPDTEAPAEMHFYFPDHKVLCLAENCTGTQHNVLTLRGAVVRDALAWSRYIDEAIARYGDDVEVSIASHSWPHWGRDDVIEHMRNHRDLYRWLHDEAMRLTNLGYTPDEIAAEVELPPGLWADWSCHGYYGTVSHNVRAVYQRYLGWYDGHPASLEPHPPVESARRYIEFMGGIDSVVDQARVSFDEGDYRWVAQVLRHAVFADPGHTEARALQADAFEQLAYQCEAGPWRDVYLTGAMELRQGTLQIDHYIRPRDETASGMSLLHIFDYLSIRLRGAEAAALGNLAMRWETTDTGESAWVELSNGTLHSRLGSTAVAGPADVTVRCERSVLNTLLATDGDLGAEIEAGAVQVDGDAGLVTAWWKLLDVFPMFFAIIEP